MSFMNRIKCLIGLCWTVKIHMKILWHLLHSRLCTLLVLPMCLMCSSPTKKINFADLSRIKKFLSISPHQWNWARCKQFYSNITLNSKIKNLAFFEKCVFLKIWIARDKYWKKMWQHRSHEQVIKILQSGTP